MSTNALRLLGRVTVLAVLGLALGACTPRDPVAELRCDAAGRGSDGRADADGDGLCDCLRLGVLGFPGQWGTNNLIRGWMHAKAVPTAILGGRALTPELLAGLDVVVVQDVRDGVDGGTVGQEGVGLGIGREFSDAEVEAVRAWVAAGGGLMTLTGFSGTGVEVTNVNRLLAPFGLSYGAERILLGDEPSAIASWDAAHPVAAGVVQVGVNGGFQVAGGSVIASVPSPGPYDLGRATQSGRGHVFAWGDEWITYDSEWDDARLQVRRLWQNALAWLTVEGYCQAQPGGASR